MLRIRCAEVAALAALQSGSVATASAAIHSGLHVARLAGLASGGRRLLLLQAEVSARQGLPAAECFAALAAAGATGGMDASTEALVLASACVAAASTEDVGGCLANVELLEDEDSDMQD